MLLKLFLGLEFASAAVDGAVFSDFGHVVDELVEQVSQTLDLFKLFVCCHVLSTIEETR